MEQLDVINIQRREIDAVDISRPARQPDKYDRVVAKAFWFVIGFSIALMICCVAFGQTLYA